MGAAQELLLRAADDREVALRSGVLQEAPAPRSTPALWTHRQLYHEPTTGQEPLPLSPWHDIPIANADGTLNMVVEIPKWSRAKVECATDEPYNPLKLDSKKGAVRTYGHGDMLFNYGFLPQTWEDPAHVHPDTGAGGDNDPLDVVELGMRAWPIGTVLRVKPLGIMAMIDGGETDWKLLTVAVSDPVAPMLSDIEDVNTQLPGTVAAAHRWFRLYKWPEVNSFAFGGQALDRQYAERIVAETHKAWRTLVDAE